MNDSKCDKVKEFLEKEIEISERREHTYSNCFDGVLVGHEKVMELLESHIRFCKNVLKVMEE